jgi:hypothetical protein
MLIPVMPPRPDWESQGGISIVLALGSPRRPLGGPEGLPASIAPPQLAGEGTDTRGKRAREVTKRYREAREDGEIESIDLLHA